jgi:hypothetical protein
MLRTLNLEGFEIRHRELLRLRARYRWLLRVPNAGHTKPVGAGAGADTSEVDAQEGESLMDQFKPVTMVGAANIPYIECIHF